TVERDGSRITNFETQSGIVVKRVYTPEDLGDVSYDRDLGLPGEYPYTRGIYPEMYRKRLWLKSIIVCDETPRATNEKYKKLIARGQTGLRIVGDIPTSLAIDPDHPLGTLDVASNGCPVFALNELDEYLDGIPLENVDFESAFGGPHAAFNLYSMLVAVCENRGKDLSKLRGSCINDPIHSLGCHIFNNYPLEVGKRLHEDLTEFAVQYTPKWHPFVGCGYDTREAGVNAIEEMGFIIASVIEYCDAALKRGIDFRQLGSKITFSVSSEIDFFETIAKVRATRRIWARIAKERFGASPEFCKCLFAIRPAGDSLTAQQPINNIARIVIEALAGVFAGAQSLDLPGFDEPFGIPSEAAELINLDLQHIITHETGIPLAVDALGGSYYVESLTNTFDREIGELLREIEGMGGMYAALQKGWVEERVRKASIERQEEIEKKERIVVGVNEFQVPKEKEFKIPLYKHDLRKAREEALAKLERLKEMRDTERVKIALVNLRENARKDVNLVRPSIEAFKASATIGEVTGMIREGMGYRYDHFGAVERPSFL
ncbi:MAG: methylmalonyl-CoA mutase family protein, partial [Pseudomonadota bacterium]